MSEYQNSKNAHRKAQTHYRKNLYLLACEISAIGFDEGEGAQSQNAPRATYGEGALKRRYLWQVHLNDVVLYAVNPKTIERRRFEIFLIEYWSLYHSGLKRSVLPSDDNTLENNRCAETTGGIIVIGQESNPLLNVFFGSGKRYQSEKAKESGDHLPLLLFLLSNMCFVCSLRKWRKME